MKRKRDRLEIIHDILHAIKEKGNKIKPTHILYKSNLSHQMLKDYLGELISKEFIEFYLNNKGGKRYSLTDKGFKYLNDYYVIREFENSYGLN